jgi:hypothetical protein
LTEFSHISLSTNALELVVKIEALQCAGWVTRSSTALIVFNVASGCGRKTRTTFTNKGVLRALTGATILTRLINTVVNCVLAFLPCEARLADTGEAIHLINTGSTILARIDGTVINIDITVWSSPASFTSTFISE